MDTKDVIAYISGYVGCEPGLSCNNDERLETAKSEIATLTAERDALREALEAAVECGMVPDSGVSDGGLFRHSRQGQAADMIRAALSREGE